MNYIIFGGTGFIGTHLTNLIKEQNKDALIWNLDIVDPSKLDKMVDSKEIEKYTNIKNWKTPLKENQSRRSKFIYCDVRQSIENLPFTPTHDDIIFNFAAVHRTPGHFDYEYFETNIRGAENICAFAEKHGIKKIVFTSSIAPYGAAEELKKETTLPTPNTPYGISKLIAEKIHIIWQAKNEKERQLTIVRPGVVFGKGENGNFTRLYWAIKGRKFAYPGRKDTIKACIYVKELVRFILYRVEHHNEGVELYNCCYEPAYTIQHIVETIKKVTGLTTPVMDIPNYIIMPAASIIGAMGAPMGICPARVKKLQISTNICGEKLKNSGYQFKWSFEQAIKDWFEDNNNKWLK